MRTRESEIIDLALTQAIEKYIEMEPEKVADAIVADWPEQIAVLLHQFFFKIQCSNCGGINDFIEVERSGEGGFYIATLCDCEIDRLLVSDDNDAEVIP